MKTRPLTDVEGAHAGWIVHCPACEYGHLFDHRWTFNGDQESPTFTPSMLVNANIDLSKYPTLKRCHSYVTDGRIQFLGDCSHEMRGQTVDLPEA